MSKVLRSILISSLTIILFGCSFDDKTGIWTDKLKRKTANSALIKLSDDQNKFQKELNPELTINFNSQAKTNKKWIMSGLNYSNLTYHLRFAGQINKFSKYKFKKTNKKLSIIVTPESVLFSNTAGDIAKVNINTG